MVSKEIIVQPVTCFEVKGVFLVTLFPSIFQGFVSVLCGKAKGKNRVLVVHDCTLCQAYGHENCPYVKEGIKTYMIHVGKRFPSYTVLQREVTPDPLWTQIPVPKIEKAEQPKKVKEYEHTA